MVLGPEDVEFLIDRADGAGERRWAGIGLDSLLAILATDVAELKALAGLAAGAPLHIHVHASPSCANICSMNSAAGFEERRGEGMVLARWAREALLACRASFADTASFEDTADCVRMWF